MVNDRVSVIGTGPLEAIRFSSFQVDHVEKFSLLHADWGYGNYY